MLIRKFSLNTKVLAQAKNLGVFKHRTISEAMQVAKQLGRLSNKHHTDETKLKLSELKIALYSNYPEKHPNRKLAGNRSKMTYPEKLVANLFDNKGITYKHNAYIKPYWIDFLVNDIGIEVDGEKWHDVEKDAIRDAYILNSGITIIRFKAKDVIKNPEIVLSVV